MKTAVKRKGRASLVLIQAAAHRLCEKYMKCLHHDLEFELPDSWLSEVEMMGFRPQGESYLPDATKTHGLDLLFVGIKEIEPCHERAKIRGVFCDNEAAGETAKSRVLRILNLIKAKKIIEPIVVVNSNIKGFRFKLHCGSHRLHCSIALGFRKIPAILDVDPND